MGSRDYDGQTLEELHAEYPNLGKTTWTWEQVRTLERRVDDHINDCDECQERLLEPPPEDDSDYYCAVAESLDEESGCAELEYSWQPDFPRPDDPRWAEYSQELKARYGD